MGIFDIFKISSSALIAQRQRIEVISTNLANIQTTRTEDGGPYRKKEVVFTTTDVNRDKGLATGGLEPAEGVMVEEITDSQKPFEIVYDPDHPDSDENGYVRFPNVNPMEEMTDMVSASRAYEANINVINTAKEMFLKALEIGR